MYKNRVLAGVFLLSALVILNCQKADTEAPTVVATIPQDGATNVAINTNITIAFSELMDAASVSQAFSTNPTNTGEFAWNDTILTYNPGANLDTNRPYTVTITTDAKDLAGNSLTANYIFSFTTGSEASSHNIYMLGRSVLEGWFHHWGWDDNDDHPIDTLGFKLYHRYIVGPYEGAQVTVDTVRNRVENIPASSNPVIFFKLCFDDFTGGSPDEADANLARNKGIVDSVYNIVVVQYGYPLILGNALPRVAIYTDQHLISEHKQYNQYLQSFQSQHPGQVFVFDMYSVLTDSVTGALKSNYTDDPTDAHPNAAGYTALDTPFFNFLEANF